MIWWQNLMERDYLDGEKRREDNIKTK